MLPAQNLYSIKDEKGDLVADCHSILARWRNNFFQLFNVQGFCDVRHTEIHTAEPLVPEPSAYENERLLKSLDDTNHHVLIKSQQKQEVEQFTVRSTNLLIRFGIRRNCLRSGRTRSLYLSIRAIKQTVVIIEAYHFCQLRTKCYPTSCCQD